MLGVHNLQTTQIAIRVSSIYNTWMTKDGTISDATKTKRKHTFRKQHHHGKSHHGHQQFR